MTPARRIPRLFIIAFLAVFLIAAGSALAWADDEEGAKPAAEEGAADAKPKLTLKELEVRVTSNPLAFWIGILSRFGAIAIGVLLLIRYWLFWDKVRGGLIPPPLKIEPPVVFTGGVALALAAFSTQILPYSIAKIAGGVDSAGNASVQTGILAVGLSTVPVAAVIVLRRHRLGPTVTPRAEVSPAQMVAEQVEDVTAPGMAPAVASPATAEALDAEVVDARVVDAAGAPKRSLLQGFGLGIWTFCVAAVVVVPAFMAAAAIILAFGKQPEPQALVQEVVTTTDASIPIWVMVYGVLVAPFAEECIFRAMLYPAFKAGLGGGKKGAVWSAVIVSFLFALVHNDMTAFLPLFFLAMVLTWVYERTNSLTAVIVAHATNNFLSLLPLLLIRG